MRAERRLSAPRVATESKAQGEIGGQRGSCSSEGLQVIALSAATKISVVSAQPKNVGFYIVLTSNLAAADVMQLQHALLATMETARPRQSAARLSPGALRPHHRKAGLQPPHLRRATRHRRRSPRIGLSFLRTRGCDLTADESVMSFLLQRGFNPRLGARPLRDTIEEYLRDAVAGAALANDLPSTAQLDERWLALGGHSAQREDGILHLWLRLLVPAV